MTEYCDRGNLQNFLEERGKIKLEENRIALWLKQICSGLENFMHRDVKAENIFLSGENLTAKLGDLGLVKVLESPTGLAMTFCGSPYYMSPDILSHCPYGIKTDIWALGVIVYELSTLDKPFDASSMYSLTNKVLNEGVSIHLPPMPEEGYSEGLVKLMEKMLSKNPEVRPSATEILGDSYYKPRRPLPEPPKPV
ncbi:hypothetical protein FSP39_013098 [Pinctada imbricata]|uniref:non-specific serine/threonine protein kinase n=1 Tax=Pinctada imbricata TaxID=66713 RepID=A0AA88YCT6_PINIB|nr:hypothetical protein FSP39_013098 [Pinctada imbricata]